LASQPRAWPCIGPLRILVWPHMTTHSPNRQTPIHTDVLIVGAGPAALFAAFELGLLRLSSHLVDALPMIGGQAAQLYGDKTLYDIPGTVQCTGVELAQRLWDQASPFSPGLSLNDMITNVHPMPDGRFELRSRRGTVWQARAVLIAGGVGAFAPRTIRGVDFAAQEVQSVHYHADDFPSELGRCVVYGGEEQALACAVALCARTSEPVQLVYRRDVLQAKPETLAALAGLREQGRVVFVTGTITGFAARGAQLTSLQIAHPDASVTKHQADHLWVMQGLSVKLGPIAEWGLAMERKMLIVDTARFATDVPGIYAVGDLITYPGKRKLIVSAFHEATLAAYAIADQLHPDGAGPQEYTTSSAKLQQKLSRVLKSKKFWL
jgi:thioredoxin reductase (NADPH)